MQNPHLEFGAGSFHGHRLTARARFSVAECLMRPAFFPGGEFAPCRKKSALQSDGPITRLCVAHDNAIIALGFARYGSQRSIERVFKGMFDAATYMDIDRRRSCFAASGGGVGAVRPCILSLARRRLGPRPRPSRCFRRRFGLASIPRATKSG